MQLITSWLRLLDSDPGPDWTGFVIHIPGEYYQLQCPVLYRIDGPLKTTPDKYQYTSLSKNGIYDKSPVIVCYFHDRMTIKLLGIILFSLHTLSTLLVQEKDITFETITFSVGYVLGEILTIYGLI